MRWDYPLLDIHPVFPDLGLIIIIIIIIIIINNLKNKYPQTPQILPHPQNTTQSVFILKIIF